MTSSTAGSRAIRSSPLGASNGTPALVRFFLARTIRWATVDSETRNARAISSVLRPPSIRSVSAMRASVESTGWHAVKTSRSRSSPMSSSSAVSRSGSVSSWTSSSWPSSSCLRSSTLLRRMWSTARFFAVAISQAPGLSGTPVSGHRSSAATRASCASSSASPTSRTTRATPAITRADSIRQTASIARCASVPVTGRIRPPSPDPCNRPPAPRAGPTPPQFGRHFLGNSRENVAQSGSERAAGRRGRRQLGRCVISSGMWRPGMQRVAG